jgi:hypothetical protein
MTDFSGESVNHNREHSTKCEIAAETLRSFGSVRLRVTGHSMLPIIWPGDTLVVDQRGFAEIIPGDIILYSRHKRLVVHRVLRVLDALEDPRLLTQGDALPNPDAPVFPSELLGRVGKIIREGRDAWTPAIPTAATRWVARILRRSASLSRLLVYLHTKRRNSAKSEGLCQV